MKTVAKALLALSIIAAVLIATPSYAGEDGSSLLPPEVIPGLESSIFKYVNADRVNTGSPAFSESSPADDMARNFSVTLVGSALFSHDQPGMPYAQRLQDAAPCGDPCSAADENLFQIDYPSMQAFLADVATDEQIDKMGKDVVDGWLASPGNRHNIEDPLLESIGIGVAVSTDGKLYVTAEFIRSTPMTDQQFRQMQGLGQAPAHPTGGAMPTPPQPDNGGGDQPPQY